MDSSSCFCFVNEMHTPVATVHASPMEAALFEVESKRLAVRL